MALYARMSFNNNGWLTPSGSAGKSPNAGNHEYDYGFGFEEWFFNPRRFKDEHGKDCHFAYLDPLRRRQRPNEKNDLILYTLEYVLVVRNVVPTIATWLMVVDVLEVPSAALQ